jgi:hypothetical protein
MLRLNRARDHLVSFGLGLEEYRFGEKAEISYRTQRCLRSGPSVIDGLYGIHSLYLGRMTRNMTDPSSSNFTVLVSM